jgi:hypothetical protein
MTAQQYAKFVQDVQDMLYVNHLERLMADQPHRAVAA